MSDQFKFKQTMLQMVPAEELLAGKHNPLLGYCLTHGIYAFDVLAALAPIAACVARGCMVEAMLIKVDLFDRTLFALADRHTEGDSLQGGAPGIQVRHCLRHVEALSPTAAELQKIFQAQFEILGPQIVQDLVRTAAEARSRQAQRRQLCMN